MRRAASLSLLLIAGLCARQAAAAADTARDATSANSASAAHCAALAGEMAGRWPDASTSVTQVRYVVDGRTGGGARGGQEVALPAHCELIAELQRRTGALGQSFAIRFHLRMPTEWNGRFLFQGGGGSNGVLGDALGRVGGSNQIALLGGYAVVSQDSGHDNDVNNDATHAGTLVFGFDAQARSNYGHASLPQVAAASQAVIARYYGAAARYAYFAGCSKGGEEALALAQRYPGYFDGILAGAPAMSLPRAAVAEAWDTQAFARLVTAAHGTLTLDTLGQVFSDAQMRSLSDAVLAACDADDGVRDGIVGAYRLCTTRRVLPQLRRRQCRAGAAVQGCLTGEQIGVLVRVMDGAHDTRGRALYTHWPWDPGMAAPGWRAWKTGLPDGSAPSRNVLLGAASLASVFTTPPKSVPADPQSLLAYQLAFDFDRDAPRIYATDAAFPQSAWSQISARSSDLDGFRARKGHLIVYHGVADPVFSVNDTIAWWSELVGRYHASLDGFARFFPVPGMNHCGGGNATDQFDALGALVTWVEEGRAPTTLTARAGTSTPWPDRERPLCAFPAVARYRGKGSVEAAASFSCVTPRS